MGTLQDKRPTNLKEGTCGIYCIENLVNGKKYVGQSIDIRVRWWQHKSVLNRGLHCNRHLQGAWNIYKEDNFKFYVLEECSVDDIDEREIYWISKFDSANPKVGYNISTGGDSSGRGVSLTEEQKENMSKAKNPKEIVQVDLEGNLVNVWRSATQAQRASNEKMRARSILVCARHEGYQAYGYLWFYKEEYDKMVDFDVKKYMFEHNAYFEIPILKYDTYGNLIKRYDSYDDIKNEYGKDGYRVIKTVCRHVKCTYKKFIWIYEYDTDFELTEDYLFHCRITSGTYIIGQYDRNNKLIRYWSKDELYNSDLNPDSVHYYCRHTNDTDYRYLNYIWKYEKTQTIEENVG